MYKTKKTLLLILISIAAIIAAFWHWLDIAYASSDKKITSSSDISLDVSYGYDNYARRGRYLPINIKVTNHSDKDISGIIKISLGGDMSDRYTYEYDISIQSDSEYNDSYDIPYGNDDEIVTIDLVDTTGTIGNVISESTIIPTTDNTKTTLFIGILCDDADKLSYFDDMGIDYGLIRTKTCNLTSDTFPSTAEALDLFDVILISDYRIRDLDERQSSSLMSWVSDGGVMILGTGDRADDTIGRYAPELLEDMYDDPVNLSIDMNNQDRMPHIESEIDEKNMSIINIDCVDILLHGGEVIEQGYEMPMISAINRDNGIIAVAAYDFVDIYDYAMGHNDYVDKLLSNILGDIKLKKLVSQSRIGYIEEYGQAQAMADTGIYNKMPTMQIYVVIIFAYIILLGPGLYMLLSDKGKLIRYRMYSIGLSVICTILIFIIGSSSRITDTFCNVATIYDTTDNNISENVWLNICNAGKGTYAADIDSSYTVLPISDGDSDDADTSGSLTLIKHREDATNITISDTSPFEAKYFKLSRNLTNDDGIGFYGNINLFGDKVTGEIVNNYDYKVTNVSLLFYGKIVLVGDMDAGESKRLDDLVAIDTPIGPSYAIAAYAGGLTDIGDVQSSDDIYRDALARANIIYFYISNYYSGYSTDARVIAFPDKNEGSDAVVSPDDATYGMTLLTSKIATSNIYDTDMIYRNTLTKSPTVRSGKYDQTSNSMIGTDSLILEYQLGDLDIISISWTLPDDVILDNNNKEGLVKFDGTISLYSYVTGDYDVIDSHNIYSMEDLEDYITPGNTLTVRYDISDNGSNNDHILPIIYVIGRQP